MLYCVDSQDITEVVDMHKKHFISLLVGVTGGLIFSIGVCMMLLPEWGMTQYSSPLVAVGAVILVVLAIVLRKMSDKPAKKPNWKLIGKIAYGVLSALVLGTGMSMIMAFEGMMITGIIIGIVGIIMLMFLIPMFTGFKK